MTEYNIFANMDFQIPHCVIDVAEWESQNHPLYAGMQTVDVKVPKEYATILEKELDMDDNVTGYSKYIEPAKIVFFGAWAIFTKGIRRLIKETSPDPDAEVWRGADGSYAIGDIADIYDYDPETDPDYYTYAGLVKEYIND
jgi:hypothetical protein